MCIYASSGCNGPIEGECVGLCMHRVQPITKYRINTETMTKPVVAIKGNVEQRMPIEYAEPEPSAIADAWDAYKTHRPRGRMKALIHAWKRLVRAFRTRHIPDPFKEHA